MIQNLATLSDSSCEKDMDEKRSNAQEVWVTLENGEDAELSLLSIDELYQLQWEQETAFAQRIKESKKGTTDRAETIQVAYQTVCQILETASVKNGESDFSMGMDDRYTQFVLSRLDTLKHSGVEGGLFEVGFGSGMLLESVSQSGFKVGGLEVASQLLEDAKQRLPKKHHANLCLGDFVRNSQVDSLAGQFGLVYWNDVFEHIPVDEIDDYLQKIYSLLTPGGQLITVTPNWHMRPMDVTADHLRPRTTAVGFHLKEYTLAEVCSHLKSAGFEHVETPLFIGKKKIWTNRFLHWTGFKKLIEPTLEWLPYSLAVQLCRRFGFTLTIATKPKS